MPSFVLLAAECIVALSIAFALGSGAYASNKVDVLSEDEIVGASSSVLSDGCADPGFNMQAEQNCVKIEDWGECTFNKNPKKPWRLDNDCKDTLDRVALRVLQMPDGKLDIVGYTDEKEAAKEKTLGSQRAVNVKYYLTTDGPNKVDASRVQPRDGGTKGQATHFYFVPEGNLCSGQREEGTVVDETRIRAR